jgi:signal transduction histidine kinase/ActR/RegA family two-component response regulator
VGKLHRVSEKPRDDLIQDFTPYQATLMAMVFPWPLHVVFNLIGALGLGLTGAPRMAAVWAVALCLADWIGQRSYRRWLLTAAEADSPRGLVRLAWAVFARTSLWFAAPVAHAVLTPSPAGFALVAVLAISTTALGVSLGWSAWTIFLAMVGPAVVSVGIALIAALGLGPAAGVLVVFASALVTLAFIAVGTNKTISEWSRANKRTIAFMTETEAALKRSEAAERRLKAAIGIANLHVCEMDYGRGVLTSLGSESEFFDQPLTYDAFLQDPYMGVAHEDVDAVKAAWARYAAGEGPYRVEYRVRRADGREVWAAGSAELTRDEAGRPLSLVGAVQNITERKRGEIELTEALARAEAGSRAKSEFLTAMSHEIRTPLNGVLGMAQAMERERLSAAQRKRVEVIRQSGQSLLILLNSVLDLSKIEAGKLELEIGEVDIAALAQSSLDMFAADAAAKDLQLTLKVSPEADGLYAGDGLRIGQVLHNLISNAVKFTQAGSVCVSVERMKGVLRVHIADTGIGVSSEQLNALFEKFSQADASVTRRFGGTGLGLAICRQLVAMMGGAVSVKSQQGHGSTFTVSLPLTKLRDAGAAKARPETDARASGAEVENDAPLRVLAAEDNPVNRMVLQTLLNQVGVDPILVEDGEQALQAWRGANWDLILMDVQMPVMDGVTASQAIRREEAQTGRPRTPIIALTANVMREQVEGYRAAGIDDVVAKPIEIERLLDAIAAALDPPIAARSGDAAAA